MNRRCVVCHQLLPKVVLLTCSPKCAKVARDQEAARLAAAEAAHRSKSASDGNRRAAPVSAAGAPRDPLPIRQRNF